MSVAPARTAVRFASGDTTCAAWHYAGDSGACVVMSGGFGITKEPGTDRFAARFVAAGFSVLAFDPRRLGGSGGEPRQVVRFADELDDWQAAIDCARGLPEVDAERVALWGFSSAGGHVIRVAVRDGRVAAVVAQTPNVDGLAVARNAGRHQTVPALLRLLGGGVLDLVGGALGRQPRLVPLAGPRGTVAFVSSPDGLQADEALDPDGAHAGWQRSVAARSGLAVGGYRPGRDARLLRCPLLVVAARDDRTALAAPAEAAARRALRGELLVVDGGHYAPFLDAHEQVVGAEIAFLRAHLVR